MVIRKDTLPDNPEELKNMLIAMAETTTRYERENDILREKVQLLSAKLFGRSSEKRTLIEPDLRYKEFFDVFSLNFEELNIPMEQIDESHTPAESKIEKDSIEVSSHERKKRGRKPLPEELHRVDVVHDIEESDKMCACGTELSRIGEDVTEQLEIQEARVYVNRHIRPKYACKCCEGIESEDGTVKIAPVEPAIIPKGIAGASLLAYVMIAKFCDALPFYRQEGQFKRIGIDLNRNTMSGWVIRIAEKCQPLMEMLKEEILSFERINMDETTVQVMNEEGKANKTKSYMWVFTGGPPDKRSFLYHYNPTRSGSVAKEFLESYKGFVQSDGYKGYNFLDEKKGIIHAGCMAHARRKFFDVTKLSGKKKSRKGLADKALNFIKDLYEVEHGMKKATGSYPSPEEVLRIRKEKSKPILDDFYKWLIEIKSKVPPKMALGKAIGYSLSQWHRLSKYVECSYLTPDNNVSERAIRPFVVGRKNWIFCGSPSGANASAVMYSLIETAKANRLDPHMYLKSLFVNLPYAKTKEEQKALLPQYIDLELLK